MSRPISYVISLFLITLLLFSKTSVQNQISGTVKVNQFLTATTDSPSWFSPAGDFTFGFHPFNNRTSDLFLLAIWYAKIPDTIVWYANGGEPVPQGSTVKIDATVGISLTDPEGNQLWNTSNDLTGSGFISYGLMNDTGNFVLRRSSDNATVWMSFAHPADTLLPTQIMNSGAEIDSRLSETNFTKGRFQMRFLDDGRLVLNTRDPKTNYSYDFYYYDSVTSTKDSDSQLVYDETGNMYILLGNGFTVNLTSDNLVPVRDYYHRATLNFDGVFIWSYHLRNITENNDVWHTTNIIPDNICLDFSSSLTDSGACGYNSICNIGEDKRPICGCPPDYSLLDPKDEYGSCKPDFQVDLCNQQGVLEEAAYTLVKLQGVDWPQEDYEQMNNCNEGTAKSWCLNDCFCGAVIYERSTGTCWKKKLPLSNGRNDSDETRIAWLKVGKYTSAPIHTKPKNKLNTLVSALLGGSVFINFILISVIGIGIFLIYQKWPYRQYTQTIGVREGVFRSTLTVKSIASATKSFKRQQMGSRKN